MILLLSVPFTGDVARAAVAINEARRRGRVTGMDFLSRFARSMPIDLFGMDAGALGGFEDSPQAQLHVKMRQRRVHLHPMRWTSLRHTLIEAMHLGMPVVALATTIEAVPVDCETILTDVERLCTALRTYRDHSERPRAGGLRARAYALERYGLERFLDAWDTLISKVTA